ncbi:MAG: HD domain-containing protein [Treponemataceae bacterium]|nr:HD domain-containing protein [Treponemataceae bacterium]
MSSLEAVIEIGSTGIRLMACQINDSVSWTVLDHSEAPVSIGNDVFTSGYVSRDTLMLCLTILNRFKEQLATWNIEPDHIHVIATSALREAKNRDSVVDRILVKTGFAVRVIDGIEENRLMYLAVQDSLRSQVSRFRTNNSIILEISGGSTEIMVLERGRMAAAHTLRLGTVIIGQNLIPSINTAADIYRFLKEFIDNTEANLRTEINLKQIHSFITMGIETKIAAGEVGTLIHPGLWTIAVDDFISFVDRVQTLSIEECMARYNLSYTDARAFGIGLLAYKLFLIPTNAEEILVTDTSIREGVILSLLAGPNATFQEEFNQQITAAARSLGQKFHYDEAHAEYVRETSLKLYDFMGDDLGLTAHSRQLLEIAAILHDTGSFIRASDHHLHSQYIIANSDIFGLSKDDMAIISRVARYHRGANPSRHDEDFALLPRTMRVEILKLSALMRIADALDRSHTQKMNQFTCQIKDNTLILRIQDTQDCTLEKIALTEKGDVFESIFGYKLLLL